jgi:RNA polymerase sigma factor (sigma-70 family)
MDTSPDAAFTTLALIRRSRRGDRLALEALFERHLPHLHRWAKGRLGRRAHDRVDTVDIVQDAAVRVFRRLDAFEPRHQGALQAYLRRAVVNRARDEHRRVGRDPEQVDLSGDITDAAHPSPFDALASGEVMDAYKRALATLSGEDRDAVVARIELGYSYDQIALMLDKPSADAARMAVTRALVRVATQMKVFSR